MAPPGEGRTSPNLDRSRFRVSQFRPTASAQCEHARQRRRVRRGRCQEFFRILIWASDTRSGSSRDGSSHRLVLQQLRVQISLGRPGGPGDVPRPRRGEIESRLAIREGSDHPTCAV
jgi:hypothetical protein